MDAIQFLKQEHETAKNGFKKIEEASGQQRGQLWKQLEPELKVHEEVEEAHFYGPIAQDTKDAQLRDWPKHHQEEVRKLESLIQQIGRLDASDERWLQKVKEVKQALEHHIQEEEQQIFPKVRQTWNQARLEQAGQEMERGKKEKLRAA